MKARLLTVFVLLVTTHGGARGDGTMTVDWKYQNAATHRIVAGSSSLTVPSGIDEPRYVSDPVLEKTVFLVMVAEGLREMVAKYNAICPTEWVNPIPQPILRGLMPPQPIPGGESCIKERASVGRTLQNQISIWARTISLTPTLYQDAGVSDLIDVARSLAKNMLENKPTVPRLESGLARVSGGPALAVASGGSQDFGFFRKSVRDGLVPGTECLKVEGLLKEFDLSLAPSKCEHLVCVVPAVMMDEPNRRLFVQLGMSSEVEAAEFQRKPLNLAVVLDISGSMSVTDNTEKTRLEWAKDALLKVISELNEQDNLSIVLFETTSQVLVNSGPVVDKEILAEKVRALSTKGSTNLEAGLRNGFEQVSTHGVEGERFEQRVILISDAGLNTGVTDETALLKLVTDYSAEGIGLTAIGMGLNFNQKFIDAIAQSRGGNYVFVQSGRDMFRFFRNFNYLVTPVAYQFKARLDLADISARLVKAYGIPSLGATAVSEVLNIQTLFFSEEGGAIVLEYELQHESRR